MNITPANRKHPGATPKYLRVLLVILGTVFTGVGILGILVPVLPTTPLLLLAAVCYARSSDRLYNWLLENRWFGRYIKDYIQNKGIRLHIKVFTITLLWTAIGVSAVFAVESLVVRIVLVVIAIGVTWHLLSMRTIRG